MGKPDSSVLYGAVLRDGSRRLDKMLEDAEQLEAVFAAPADPSVDSANEGEIAVTAQFSAQIAMVKEHLSLLRSLLRVVSSRPASSPETETVAWALSQVPSATVEDLMGRVAAVEDTLGKKPKRT